MRFITAAFRNLDSKVMSIFTNVWKLILERFQRHHNFISDDLEQIQECFKDKQMNI